MELSRITRLTLTGLWQIAASTLSLSDDDISSSDDANRDIDLEPTNLGALPIGIDGIW